MKYKNLPANSYNVFHFLVSSRQSCCVRWSKSQRHFFLPNMRLKIQQINRLTAPKNLKLKSWSDGAPLQCSIDRARHCNLFNVRHFASYIHAGMGCSRARALFHSGYVPLRGSQSVLIELLPAANQSQRTFTYLHISQHLLLSTIMMYDLQLLLFCSAVNPPDDLTYSGKLPLMVSHRHIKIAAASVLQAIAFYQQTVICC